MAAAAGAAAHACLTLDGLLPMPYRALLPYETLNAVQSRCFDAVVSSAKSVAVAAPTGCGKTAVFDLAIVRLLLERDGVPGFGAGGAGAGGKVRRRRTSFDSPHERAPPEPPRNAACLPSFRRTSALPPP